MSSGVTGVAFERLRGRKHDGCMRAAGAAAGCTSAFFHRQPKRCFDSSKHETPDLSDLPRSLRRSFKPEIIVESRQLLVLQASG